MAANTAFRRGDSEHDLLRKILTTLGGLKHPGDSAHDLLRKILSQLGSVDPASATSAWHSGAGAPSVALGEDGDFYLETATGDIYEKSAGVWSVVVNIMGPPGPGSEGRELLTGNRTYYVAPTGDDANDGRTFDTPFRTIQKAINVVAGTLDLGVSNVTISIFNGTYNEALTLLPFVGGGKVIIRGNTADDDAVIIQGVGGNAVGYYFGAQGVYQLYAVKLQTSGSGHCLSIGPGAFVEMLNVVFGAAASGYSHMSVMGGNVIAVGNYAVVGNAYHHIDVQGGGLVQINNRTVTWTGNLTFDCVVFAYSGMVYGQSMVHTVVNSVAGRRYLSDALSMIYTAGGGANYFPGNLAGTNQNGAVYL